MSRQAVPSWPSSSTVMSARRMNSNRRRPGPLFTAVVGCVGSQYWVTKALHFSSTSGW